MESCLYDQGLISREFPALSLSISDRTGGLTILERSFDCLILDHSLAIFYTCERISLNLIEYPSSSSSCLSWSTAVLNGLGWPCGFLNQCNIGRSRPRDPNCG
jgi:hypothetical protein